MTCSGNGSSSISRSISNANSTVTSSTTNGTVNTLTVWRGLHYLAIASLAALAAFLSSCLLPHNRVATLGIYENVVASDDCRAIIRAAERHAAIALAGGGNHEENTGSHDSGGWRTERHSQYATTDFKLRAIPAAAAVWEERVRDAVLPLVAEQYARDAADVRLVDLFVVKYVGGVAGAQDSLRLHTDASMASFNLALSSRDDYVGGGTHFPLLAAARAAVGGVKDVGNDDDVQHLVSTDRATLLVHDSGVIHGGAKVEAGTRYLLVGFVNFASYENVVWHWHRRFGTTARCLNVTHASAADDTVRPAAGADPRFAPSTSLFRRLFRRKQMKKEKKKSEGGDACDNKHDGDGVGNDNARTYAATEGAAHELACLGAWPATRLTFRFYTTGLLERGPTGDGDAAGGLPHSLLVFGVVVHGFALVQVAATLLRGRTGPRRRAPDA